MPHTAPNILTDDFLSSLSMDQLIDLLIYRTNLLLATTKSGIADKEYLEEVRLNVSKIHAAIKSLEQKNSQFKKRRLNH